MDEKSMPLDIRDGMNFFERMVKRVFDFTCSLLALIILSPVFLVVAIVLLWQGDGSVFFRQERIGYKGKPFNILKFRTMRADSESNGKPQLAAVNDERLTKVGKFLREHHLDELPQLVNVLWGDMSFVGPRPERRYFIDKIKQHNPNYDYLYLIRPGLTSMATLHNGYTDTMEKMLIRLNMDLQYMETASLGRDCLIMLKTIGIVFNDKSSK